MAAAMVAGAIGGALLAPAPVGAVAREIVEIQQNVALLLQGQRDMQTAITQNQAVTKTLLEQTTDATDKLNTTMGQLQKTVQDAQANSGARLDSMATQVQGLSDNLQEVMSRIGKLNQQLTDIQNALQSLDAKCSGGAPAPGTPTNQPGIASNAPSGNPPPSADVLYNNGLRDLNSGNYTLALQEFQEYLQYYPTTDLAGNAQFWIGQVYYSQQQYQPAADAFDKVIYNFPKSLKVASARYMKGAALLELGQKASAIRTFREVVRLYPGTEEERKARAKLRELGVVVAPSR